MTDILDEFGRFVEGEESLACQQQIAEKSQPATELERTAFILAVFLSFPTMGKNNKMVMLGALREFLNDMQPSNAALSIAYQSIVKKFTDFPPNIGAILAAIKDATEKVTWIYAEPWSTAIAFANDVKRDLSRRQQTLEKLPAM
jgi:hypothetical protein